MDPESELRASFKTAANSVAQMFTQSLQQINVAQNDGYTRALQDMMAWASEHVHEDGQTICANEFADFLKGKMQEKMVQRKEASQGQGNEGFNCGAQVSPATYAAPMMPSSTPVTAPATTGFTRPQYGTSPVPLYETQPPQTQTQQPMTSFGPGPGQSITTTTHGWSPVNPAQTTPLHPQQYAFSTGPAHTHTLTTAESSGIDSMDLANFPSRKRVRIGAAADFRQL
eukprot:GFYU01014207.1.p1 GENE.GFYU01014207.1~~GFYU01014207.1.p1  ORF type:complete len:227 (+),score=38.79 GFYU01014207.1:124-804(+)